MLASSSSEFGDWLLLVALLALPACLALDSVLGLGPILTLDKAVVGDFFSLLTVDN